jgi:hypothetical protein
MASIVCSRVPLSYRGSLVAPSGQRAAVSLCTALARFSRARRWLWCSNRRETPSRSSVSHSSCSDPSLGSALRIVVTLPVHAALLPGECCIQTCHFKPHEGLPSCILYCPICCRSINGTTFTRCVLPVYAPTACFGATVQVTLYFEVRGQQLTARRDNILPIHVSTTLFTLLFTRHR